MFPTTLPGRAGMALAGAALAATFGLGFNQAAHAAPSASPTFTVTGAQDCDPTAADDASLLVESNPAGLTATVVIHNETRTGVTPKTFGYNLSDGHYPWSVTIPGAGTKNGTLVVHCATTPPPTSTTPKPTEEKVSLEPTFVMPGSTGTVVWPQYTPTKWKELLLPAGVCQVDRWRGTQRAIDAVIGDGKLTQGEDAALLDYSRPFPATGKPWMFEQPGQGKCPALTTATPTPPVATTPVATTPATTAPSTTVTTPVVKPVAKKVVIVVAPTKALSQGPGGIVVDSNTP